MKQKAVLDIEPGDTITESTRKNAPRFIVESKPEIICAPHWYVSDMFLGKVYFVTTTGRQWLVEKEKMFYVVEK